MREERGEGFPRFLLFFYLMQAAWAVLFALPMLLAARNPEPFGLADRLAIAIWMLSVAGEAVADRQLAAFRRDPANRGQVCRAGLWAWSRHPNYFFEWIHWWSYVLLGFGGPAGALTLLGPLVMLAFLTRVTGIPPTEARLLESRGEAYREYQRTVNAFFPGPPRRPR
jgi:steroid 5-alpha reductase family enzyme